MAFLLNMTGFVKGYDSGSPNPCVDFTDQCRHVSTNNPFLAIQHYSWDTPIRLSLSGLGLYQPRLAARHCGDDVAGNAVEIRQLDGLARLIDDSANRMME